MLKICTRCCETKAATDFPKKATRRDGRASQCKSCASANYKANQKRYDATNKIAYEKRMADPSNREAHRLRSERNRRENPLALRAAVSDWKKRNPEQRNAHERTRRARIAGSTGRHQAADIEKILRRQKGRCAYCDDVLSAYHVDHKTPLSRGGSNGPENLTAACPPCNLRKGVLTATEFMARRENWAKS